MGLGVAWFFGRRSCERPCRGNQGRRGARTTSVYAAVPAGPCFFYFLTWDRLRPRPLGGHAEFPRERPLAAHPVSVLVLLLRHGQSDYVLGGRAANISTLCCPTARSRGDRCSAAANGDHRAQPGRFARQD